MWTAKFWKDLTERVLATIAGSVLALLTADGVFSVDIGWKQLLLVAALAGAVSLLKGFVATLRGDPTSASLASVSLGSGLQRFDNEGDGLEE